MKKKECINKESLIGKKYYPIDNSYCVNLTACAQYPYNNDRGAYLAGNMIGESQKECTIVSEPFMCKIKPFIQDVIKEHEMILVNYNNNTYSILFFRECVK